MENRFQGALKAYTNLNYIIHTRDIRDIDTEVLNWLNNIPYKTWARYLFNTKVKVKNITSSLAKSFNSWIEK